jgi:hypothetical protein
MGDCRIAGMLIQGGVDGPRPSEGSLITLAVESRSQRGCRAHASLTMRLTGPRLRKKPAAKTEANYLLMIFATQAIWWVRTAILAAGVRVSSVTSSSTPSFGKATTITRARKQDRLFGLQFVYLWYCHVVFLGLRCSLACLRVYRIASISIDVYVL